jgi:hypothetical protein
VQVLADAQHHRDRAEPAEDASDADRVGDRLPQAVPRREPEVTQRGVDAAHLDLVDHAIGPRDGGGAIRVPPRSRTRRRSDGRSTRRRVRHT